MRRVRSAVLLALIVAACTPARAPWTAPGVAKAEAESEWEDCKRLARDRTGGMDRMAASSRTPENPLDAADRQKAATDSRRIVESCMRAKGFTPIKQ
ncbi:MAG: hypothetical protein WCZ23_17305 [Rhodospirillaceae bacterium]